MPAIEQTFIMIKPDAVRDRKTGQIIDRIERSGLTIEKMEKCVLDEETVKVHYAHLADKPFFPSLVAFMTSGPWSRWSFPAFPRFPRCARSWAPPTRSTPRPAPFAATSPST